MATFYCQMKALGLFLILCIPAVAALSDEWRWLSDGEGGGVKARAVALIGDGRILLENEGGQQFETPLEVLAESDRAFFLSWQDAWKERAQKGKLLNEAIGHAVFNDSWRLWDEQVAKVATRLKWGKESETPYSSSYRKYTGADYRFLGARPFSVVAYGDDRGQVASLSIVYANKGDSFSGAGMGEDHFTKGEDLTTMEKFERALDADANTLTAALTKTLGEGNKQRYGEGKDRRTVTRWDWNGHSFILSQEDEEYVGLLVVSTEEAENKGRTDLLSDDEMRKRLEGSIVHKENGDVFLRNIPMVNQGPKGYCAPATFERAMRYLGVPADMYLLAVSGGTAPGGGTNTGRLFDEVRSGCYRKGRRMNDIKIEPRMREVIKYIDKGVPIMWQMCSLPDYNKAANQRTKERKKVTDWSAYAARIAEEAEANAEKMEEVKGNYHICMIIGYNETTQEVAVSDSWGAYYEIRWVHLDEAQAVSNGSGFVIQL